MSNLDELRDYYDDTDVSEAITGAVREEPVDEVLVSTSIRPTKAVMDRVRAQADQAGVPATTLMRQWIIDRLEGNAGPGGGNRCRPRTVHLHPLPSRRLSRGRRDEGHGGRAHQGCAGDTAIRPSSGREVAPRAVAIHSMKDRPLELGLRTPDRRRVGWLRQPRLEIRSRQASSQRRHALAHSRQCWCISAWLAHSSPQALHAAAQASRTARVRLAS